MKNDGGQKKQAGFGIRGRLVLTIGVLILVAVGVQAAISYVSLSRAYDMVIMKTQEGLDDLIRNQVQGLIGVLDANYKRCEEGKISEEEAMAIAKDLVRDTRYDNGEGEGKGYFWADDSSGVCVIHSNAEYEGQERYDFKDVKGNLYIQGLLRAGNTFGGGGGFSDFWFTKPGKEGDYQKRAYTAVYEPYGWYISTGNYQEDMQQMIAAELASCQSQKSTALAVMLGVSAAIFLIGLGTAFWLSGGIAKPLVLVTERLRKVALGDLKSPVPQIRGQNETAVLAQATQTTVSVLNGIILDLQNNLYKMADGDFHIHVEHDYPGDTRPIRAAIEGIAGSLNRALRQIEDSSHRVSAGANMVSCSSQSLSQGASEQAGAVKRLSRAIGDISGQIKKSAGYAEKADLLANDVGSKIEQSSEQMKRMTSAITEISEGSEEISKIIKTIEDIAFQTNILALNAAVEAARAGEAGKGFAVVADEVRNLAVKSGEAAKNTTALIEGSVKSVERGTAISKDAARSLKTVVDGAKKVVLLVGNISTAARQQSEAIEEVTEGVNQIAGVVQNNSDTAQESAMASEELNSQAVVLQQLVDSFSFLTQEEEEAQNSLEDGGSTEFQRDADPNFTGEVMPEETGADLT